MEKLEKKIMTRKTILWPLRTVWLARLNFRDNIIQYEFETKDGKYSYAGNIRVKFTLSDVEAVGLEISHHRVTYNLFSISISAK